VVPTRVSAAHAHHVSWTEVAVKLERFQTPRAFLVAAESFLLRAEAENSLILGIAHAAASEDSDVPPTPYFAAVLDPEVCLCAFSTLPAKLGVTRCDAAEALALLARDAHSACPRAREILGPEPTAGAFAERFAALRACRVRRDRPMRIHELTAVTWPDQPPPGRFRRAEAADVPLLSSWVREFAAEVDDDQGDPEHVAASRVASGQLFLWEDGGPVAMAGWTGRTAHTVRISLVYTPPAARSQGYATACVAALSQAMLDAGSRSCCLYTDLANPTSNAIYRSIGYRPVSDTALYTLVTVDESAS
jgi:GNAT superfamily N-acetyltransferase